MPNLADALRAMPNIIAVRVITTCSSQGHTRVIRGTVRKTHAGVFIARRGYINEEPCNEPERVFECEPGFVQDESPVFRAAVSWALRGYFDGFKPDTPAATFAFVPNLTIAG